MNDFVKYLLWAVCLVLLQEFLFNNIQFIHFLSPYIYIFLIIILPFNMHPSLVMFVAFGLGLSVDVVSDGVLGSHAAACTVMAYCRNIITKITMPRGDYENTSTATALHINLMQFVLYSLLLVFIHHFILFFVEIFTLKNFIFTLIQIIASTVISTIFIILIKLLFGYNKDA